MAYGIAYVTDEHTTCSCCGKRGLKKVVMLQPMDCDGNPEGDPEPFGTSCAARTIGFNRPKSSATMKHILDLAEVQMRRALREAETSVFNSPAFVLHRGYYFLRTFWRQVMDEGRDPMDNFVLRQNLKVRDAAYPFMDYSIPLTRRYAMIPRP